MDDGRRHDARDAPRRPRGHDRRELGLEGFQVDWNRSLRDAADRLLLRAGDAVLGAKLRVRLAD